jgi:hypothetical protein
MRLDQISASESLQILYDVDRGALTPESVKINGSTESRICFKGAWMEDIQIKGQKTGVALHGRSGGLLVRRGHAKSKRYALDSTEKLNFYWITEAGRMAAQSSTETS